MSDFFTTSMMFPQMAFRIAASMSAATLDMQMRILRQQGALFDHLYDKRRIDDRAGNPHAALVNSPANPVNPKAKKRRAGKQPSPCCGPDLMDHYGKRAHDVDVERDI